MRDLTAPERPRHRAVAPADCARTRHVRSARIAFVALRSVACFEAWPGPSQEALRLHRAGSRVSRFATRLTKAPPPSGEEPAISIRGNGARHGSRRRISRPQDL